MIDFTPFPKIYRLNRGVIVTEKIDGTNAQICIHPVPTEESLQEHIAHGALILNGADNGDCALAIMAGSRNTWLTPKTDNFGFCNWVYDHAQELAQLGPGRHYGEWWGKGIQRNYDLDHRRFSLFHTHGILHKPDIVHVVPTISIDVGFASARHYLRELELNGSWAAPGFMKPEGIVCYHAQGNVLFKATIEKDDEHKGQTK